MNKTTQKNKQNKRYSYTCQPSNKLKRKVHSKRLIEIVQPKQNNQNNIALTIVFSKTQFISVFIAKTTIMAQVKKILTEKCTSKFVKPPKKVIGFETMQNNYTLDYKLEHGLGKIQQPMSLRPIYQSSETGINSYKICQCLATGGFSKVFLIRCLKTGKFFAGKYIDKKIMSTDEKKQLIKNQIDVNEELSHCFLTKMHQFIESDNFYILVLDYCPGGELFYLLRRHRKFTENQARFYIIEILLGIQYMHQNGIIYRDLKPENIMVDEIGHVKITDFGLAKHCNKRGRLYSYCGSLQYMAPEILSSNGHFFQVDYYCIGALLFQLLVGCPPFYSPKLSQEQTKYHIVNTSVVFPLDIPLSNDVKDLMTKLLQKNAKKRLGSLGSVKEILCHRWFGNINLTKSQYLQKKISVPFPTDLSSLNFDEKQIGVSQQRFTRKISTK